MVVACFEPVTIQFAAESIYRYTIGLVGKVRRPTHTRLVGRSEGYLKSAIFRLSSGCSGRVGPSVAFFLLQPNFRVACQKKVDAIK